MQQTHLVSIKCTKINFSAPEMRYLAYKFIFRLTKELAEMSIIAYLVCLYLVILEKKKWFEQKF